LTNKTTYIIQTSDKAFCSTSNPSIYVMELHFVATTTSTPTTSATTYSTTPWYYKIKHMHSVKIIVSTLKMIF